jgi:uncharacterized membrane protein
MMLLGSLGRLLLLAGLGYLGFYGFGVVMGVFSPFEMIGFTVLAGVFAAAYAVHAIRVRRAMRTHGQHEAIMREAHVYRERRGF